MFSEDSLQSFIPERVTINIRVCVCVCVGGGGGGGVVINGLGCSKSQKLINVPPPVY